MNRLSHVSRNRSQGFTLIELMIVIVIIAILAALSLNMYSSYVARSQLYEAFSLSTGVKFEIARRYSENKEPAYYCDPSLLSNLVTSGKYVQKIEITTSDPCSFTITMKQEGVNDKIKSKSVVIAYNPAGGAQSNVSTWVCTSEIASNIIPESCQHTD